jgi:hypothetical protein
VFLEVSSGKFADENGKTRYRQRTPLDQGSLRPAQGDGVRARLGRRRGAARCFNAKLHEGTTWHGVRWPKPPKDVELAQTFVDAYERLKLEMDKLKKHGDELDFFALEQQCRCVVLGRWRGMPIALYGCLSDYGRSYTRPLVLLAATVIVGAFLLATSSVGFWTPLLSADWGRALQSSFASTFNVVLGRAPVALIEPNDLASAGAKCVSITQLFVGLILLFLFGLGIRNRFRMK